MYTLFTTEIATRQNNEHQGWVLSAIHDTLQRFCTAALSLATTPTQALYNITKRLHNS